VQSIRNANLSIKYEGIQVQKWLIACNKGIIIAVRFQYSEVSSLESSIFYRQLKTKQKVEPEQHLEDKPGLHFQWPLLLHPLPKMLRALTI